MSYSSVIHTRIDSATKEATERVLSSLGLTPTEAIRLFYRQIAIRGEFPLELKVPNAQTREAMAEARTMAQARVARFNSADALFDGLEKAGQQ